MFFCDKPNPPVFSLRDQAAVVGGIPSMRAF